MPDTADAQPQDHQRNADLYQRRDHAKAAAEDAGLTLGLEIDPSVPLVRGDAGKLRQIFGNLLSNAIKFTHAGGTVTIEASRTNDGGAAILVHDTGVGMSEEEIAIGLTPFGVYRILNGPH